MTRAAAITRYFLFPVAVCKSCDEFFEFMETGVSLFHLQLASLEIDLNIYM